MPRGQYDRAAARARREARLNRIGKTNECEKAPGSVVAAPTVMTDPAPIVVVLEKPEEFDYPAGWTRGEQLSFRKSGNQYILHLTSEDPTWAMPERLMIFESSWDADRFQGWWYAPQVWRR